MNPSPVMSCRGTKYLESGIWNLTLIKKSWNADRLSWMSTNSCYNASLIACWLTCRLLRLQCRGDLITRNFRSNSAVTILTLKNREWILIGFFYESFCWKRIILWHMNQFMNWYTNNFFSSRVKWIMMHQSQILINLWAIIFPHLGVVHSVMRTNATR